jgi:hypothetical protein
MFLGVVDSVGPYPHPCRPPGCAPMASHSRRVRNAFEMLHAQSVQDATAAEEETVAVAVTATAGLRGRSGTGSTLLPPRDDADERRRRLDRLAAELRTPVPRLTATVGRWSTRALGVSEDAAVEAAGGRQRRWQQQHETRTNKKKKKPKAVRGAPRRSQEPPSHSRGRGLKCGATRRGTGGRGLGSGSGSIPSAGRPHAASAMEARSSYRRSHVESSTSPPSSNSPMSSPSSPSPRRGSPCAPTASAASRTAAAALGAPRKRECPRCVPGSGKPLGHRGKHRTKPMDSPVCAAVPTQGAKRPTSMGGRAGGSQRNRAKLQRMAPIQQLGTQPRAAEDCANCGGTLATRAIGGCCSASCWRAMRQQQQQQQQQQKHSTTRAPSLPGFARQMTRVPGKSSGRDGGGDAPRPESLKEPAPPQQQQQQQQQQQRWRRRRRQQQQQQQHWQNYDNGRAADEALQPLRMKRAKLAMSPSAKRSIAPTATEVGTGSHQASLQLATPRHAVKRSKMSRAPHVGWLETPHNWLQWGATETLRVARHTADHRSTGAATWSVSICERAGDHNKRAASVRPAFRVVSQAACRWLSEASALALPALRSLRRQDRRRALPLLPRLVKARVQLLNGDTGSRSLHAAKRRRTAPPASSTHAATHGRQPRVMATALADYPQDDGRPSTTHAVVSAPNGPAKPEGHIPTAPWTFISDHEVPRRHSTATHPLAAGCTTSAVGIGLRKAREQQTQNTDSVTTAPTAIPQAALPSATTDTAWGWRSMGEQQAPDAKDDDLSSLSSWPTGWPRPPKESSAVRPAASLGPKAKTLQCGSSWLSNRCPDPSVVTGSGQQRTVSHSLPEQTPKSVPAAAGSHAPSEQSHSSPSLQPFDFGDECGLGQLM